jgi:hypothetical protein
MCSNLEKAMGKSQCRVIKVICYALLKETSCKLELYPILGYPNG